MTGIVRLTEDLRPDGPLWRALALVMYFKDKIDNRTMCLFLCSFIASLLTEDVSNEPEFGKVTEESVKTQVTGLIKNSGLFSDDSIPLLTNMTVEIVKAMHSHLSKTPADKGAAPAVPPSLGPSL